MRLDFDANLVEYEGMPRIQEVLETHDWSALTESNDPDADPELDIGPDDDLESDLLDYSRSAHTAGFGHEVHELEREMFGLRMAIERGGDDAEDDAPDEELDVESMDALMMRMQAIRGTSGCATAVIILTQFRYEHRLARGRAEEVCRQSSPRYYAAAIKSNHQLQIYSWTSPRLLYGLT